MADLGYGPLTPAWATLERLATKFESESIRSLFESDSGRATRLSREGHGLFLDFSRQRLDQSVLEALFALADQTGVQSAIGKMFDGERINVTEDRAALHVALRRPAERELLLDGEDVMPLVEVERKRIATFCDELAAGRMQGHTGRCITDVVNIGIGGSDLGPEMTVISLAEYRDPNISLHFVSNIDGVGMTHVLRKVDPETTLFVICSKSFTTLETLTNADITRSWLLEHGGSAAVAKQVVAVSTNHDAMDAFGVAAENRFDMWDWVGGRYSVWSAVGLSLALAIGRENFERFLRGANEMDEHFLSAPIQENLPILLALVGIWNR
ncbi:MAG: glucose-6-phosphate isomerase, partial [Gammaproteobacteria bacterium]